MSDTQAEKYARHFEKVLDHIESDLAVDFGISGHYVIRVLDQAARFRGYASAMLSKPPESPER